MSELISITALLGCIIMTFWNKQVTARNIILFKGNEKEIKDFTKKLEILLADVCNKVVELERLINKKEKIAANFTITYCNEQIRKLAERETIKALLSPPPPPDKSERFKSNASIQELISCGIKEKKALAEASGLSIKTVERNLKALLEEGKIEAHNTRPKTYTIKSDKNYNL